MGEGKSPQNFTLFQWRIIVMLGDVVSKETVCCVGGKVKH